MSLCQVLLGTNVQWSFEIDVKFLQKIIIFASLYFTLLKKMCSGTFEIDETFLQLLIFTLLFWWETGRHVEVGHNLSDLGSLFFDQMIKISVNPKFW